MIPGPSNNRLKVELYNYDCDENICRKFKDIVHIGRDIKNFKVLVNKTRLFNVYNLSALVTFHYFMCAIHCTLVYIVQCTLVQCDLRVQEML